MVVASSRPANVKNHLAAPRLRVASGFVTGRRFRGARRGRPPKPQPRHHQDFDYGPGACLDWCKQIQETAGAHCAGPAAEARS